MPPAIGTKLGCRERVVRESVSAARCYRPTRRWTCAGACPAEPEL